MLNILSDLRKPCIGFKRREYYKKLSSRSSIVRKVGTNLNMTCFADSIPEASVYWSRGKFDNKKVIIIR